MNVEEEEEEEAKKKAKATAEGGYTSRKRKHPGTKMGRCCLLFQLE